MRTLTLNKRFATAVTLAALGIGSTGVFVGPSHAAEQGQNDRDTIAVTPLSERWFTKPSEDVALDFSAPGLIAEVVVKEGDAVKKGQVLAKQDVSVEAANKAMYEIEANSAVEEEYARKDLELKKVKFQKTESLFKQKNATYLEVEEARLEVERADASVKLATQKRQVSAAQAATEQAKIDLKQIKAPFDGVVSKLDTHVGEVANSQADRAAIRVVKNNPLWVDAHLAAAVTARLTKG